jgi:hypothetical protein
MPAAAILPADLILLAIRWAGEVRAIVADDDGEAREVAMTGGWGETFPPHAETDRPPRLCGAEELSPKREPVHDSRAP